MQALDEKERELNLALLSFAEAGNTEKCKKALQDGAYVHTSAGWLNCTPLILACMNGHRDTAIVLIDQFGAGENYELHAYIDLYIITPIHSKMPSH